MTENIIRSGLFLIFFFLLSSCGQQPQLWEQRFLAMGTVIDLSVAEPGRLDLPEVGRIVEDDFSYLHTAWHPWEAGPLGRVNQLLPLQGRFSAPPHVLELIELARPLSLQSGGLFNPAIGQLMQLWNFDRDGELAGPPPAAADINIWLEKSPSLSDIDAQGMTLRSSNSALLLDFGAFAKGVAVDKVIAHLRDLGIHNAIINAGGDLRAIGSRFGKPWRIGIRDPDGDGVLASLEIKGDMSVFTSGDYERFYVHQGKRYHHILDPRTGYPAEGVRSVTVLHASAAVADAAATALFVAGPGQWRAVANAMDVNYVMLVDSDRQIHLTAAMSEQVRLVENHKYKVLTP